MTRTYLKASLMILLILWLRGLCTKGVCRGQERPEVAFMSGISSAETNLALGRPIRFAAADVYDLEFLTGISDVLAQRFIENKSRVQKRAAALPPGERHIALQLVKGIGPQKAAELSALLDLTTP